MSNNKYPYKTVKGQKKRVHRHIMEDYLGRILSDNEHVYHMNGDPSDNHIENLVVIKRKSFLPKTKE